MVSDFSKIEDIYCLIGEKAPLFSPHARIQFKLIEKLGEGGMGVVHRIKDKKLGRNAALKVLGNRDADERAIVRFVREARITASLVHPNIPPIYELGMNSSGEHYMLMKVIEGQSLKQAIREVHGEGKADPKEIRRLLEALVKVCEAMAYAHSRNVIHRDLKPENIMIGEFGEVMVLDWGLARDLGADDEDIDLNDQKSMRLKEAAIKEGLTGAGDLLGTVGYMAPEQIDGQACKQSDVFALGAILTEILTGKRAIEGEGAIAKLSATIQGRIHGPRALLATAPKELNALAIKAMAMTRKNRVAGVEELVRDLKAYLEGTELAVYRYGLVTRSQRWVSRHPAIMSSSLLVLLIVFVGLYYLQVLDEAERRDRESVAVRAATEATRKRLKQALDFFNEVENKSNRGFKKEELSREIERALELGGRTEYFLLRGARIYKKAGLMEEARVLLREVEARFPPAFEALVLLNEIEAEKTREQLFFADSPTLRRLLNEAKSLNKENEYTLLAEASLLESNPDWKMILALAERAERYTKNNWRIFALKGTALLWMGKFERAEWETTKAIELDPENPGLFSLRGGLRSQLGEYEGAVFDFTRSISLNPTSVKYFNRGVVYEKANLTKQALADYSESLRLKANIPQCLFNRGRLYKLEKKYQQAVVDFEKALEMNPNYALAHSELGHSKDVLGEFQPAMYHYNKALKLRPSAVTYSNRGHLLLRGKKMKEAFADFAHALELDPKHISARLGYCHVLSLEGKYKEAIDCYTEGLRQRSHYMLYNNRGVMRTRVNDFSGGLRDFEMVAKLKPDFSMVHMNRVRLWMKAGENKKAAHELEVYLSKVRGTAYDEDRRAFIKKHLGRPSRY